MIGTMPHSRSDTYSRMQKGLETSVNMLFLPSVDYVRLIHFKEFYHRHNYPVFSAMDDI